MDLNPEINYKIHEMAAKYSKQLGLDKVPVITFTRDEVRMATDEKRFKRMENYLESKGNRALGQASKGLFWGDVHDLIYINVAEMEELYGFHSKKEVGRKETRRGYWIYWEKVGHLEETLIHELIHIRFPLVRHGWGFKSKIKAVMNGKKYPRETLRERLYLQSRFNCWSD